MNRLALLVSFMLLCFNALAQEYNRVDEQGRKQGKWVRSFSDADQVRYTGQFTDNKPVGEFKYYYSTGQLQAVTNFIDGAAFARSTIYHVNGKVMAVGNYRNQLKDSIWTFYDERGILSAHETYVLGKLNGKRTVYYMDGQVSEICYYKDDVKHGEYKQWFFDGKPKMEGQCLNDTYDGKITFYHENGNKMLEGKYQAAVKNGNWYKYKSSGELEQVLYYKWGKLLDEEQLKNYKKYKEKERQGAVGEGFTNDDPIKGAE